MEYLQPIVLSALLPTVEKLIRRVADDEILSRFRHLKESDVHYKGASSDLVTTADWEAEDRIREGLLDILPGSCVIGEESAYQSPEILHRLNGSKPVWIVDPLDGTRNFAHAKPCFAVICALVENGETILGWILDPISGNCISVRKDYGAHIDGRKLTIQSALNIKDMCGSLSADVRERLEKRRAGSNIPTHFTRYHCVGREYMDLSLGKLHFALYGGKMWPWDHAAGALMVSEVGGTVRTLNSGLPYSPGDPGDTHAERLLIAPDLETFAALKRMIINENGMEKQT